MSVDPVEEKRQQINLLIEEIARLSESNVPPEQFSTEFIQRILVALAASIGIVWMRTPQGNLQMQYQVGMPDLNLDSVEEGKASHDLLLRSVFEQGKSACLLPKSGPGMMEGAPAPSNPTNYILMLAPIIIENKVAGIVEIGLDPNRNPAALRGFLQFLVDMAGYAGTYFKGHQLRTVLSQQQVWTQLEAYTRQIHSSLNIRENTFVLVNETRRILSVDRVSVASRLGGHTKIEAVSGADVVEKRSSLILAMKALFEAVFVWNERLVYSGTRDETLPPKVLKALDEYLAESNSKLLLITPLRDERENKDRPTRSAMMVECFEPNFTSEAIMARSDVLVKHAAPAMYNTLEHHRIPFRWFLQPIADIRDTLRGRRLTWFLAGLLAAALLVAALILVPYPLRLYAKGKFVPKERQTIYSKLEGQITPKVFNGSRVERGTVLFEVNSPQLQAAINKQTLEINSSEISVAQLEKSVNQAGISEQERQRYQSDLIETDKRLQLARSELKILQDQAGGSSGKVVITSPNDGIVVTFDTNELRGKMVKPGDALVQIAQVDGPWEVQLNLAEMHVAKLREALANTANNQLEVDVKLESDPDVSYRCFLHKDGLGGMVSNMTADNEPALPLRCEIGPDLKKKLEQLEGRGMPVEIQVQAKVRCGNRSVGYVWFYQLWEFFFEHVVF